MTIPVMFPKNDNGLINSVLEEDSLADRMSGVAVVQIA